MAVKKGDFHILVEELKQLPRQCKMSFGILAEQLGAHTDATIKATLAKQASCHLRKSFTEYLVCFLLPHIARTYSVMSLPHSHCE